MSSESLIALVAVITSGVLGVASLGFNFWNSSSERRQRLKDRREDNREWHRRTLFDRRLEALQEASRWLDRLSDAMYNPYTGGGTIPISEALEWYAKNIVYLHGEMPDRTPVGRFLYSSQAALEAGDVLPDEQLCVEARDYVAREANELLEGLEK